MTKHEQVCDAIGVSLSDMQRGEKAFEVITASILADESMTTISLVKIVDALDLHSRVKLFLMHKLTAWLHRTCDFVPYSDFKDN
jgi:hypothetical protein